MNRKKVVAMVSGLSALALVATCGPALAFGHHGHGHRGGEQFALYARADGITHDQIKTAFQNSPVKTDFQNVRAAKKVVDACIIAGNCSTTDISTYETDLATLQKDKLAVWQNLFLSANKTPGVNLKTTLDSLNQQKHAAFKTAFGGSSNAPTAESTQQ